MFFFGLSFLSLVVIAAATTDQWVQGCRLLLWGVIITVESGGKWDKNQINIGNVASVVLPVSPATVAASLLLILFFFLLLLIVFVICFSWLCDDIKFKTH